MRNEYPQILVHAQTESLDNICLQELRDNLTDENFP